MARKDRPIRRLYITKDLQLLGEIEEITVYPLIGGGTQLGSNEPSYENKTVSVLAMGFRAGLVVSITSFLLGKHHEITFY